MEIVKWTCTLTTKEMHSTYPMFECSRSQDNCPNACYVHDKQHDDGCTYTDFQEFLDCNADKGSQTDVEHADFTRYRHYASITSPFAEQLLDALKK